MNVKTACVHVCTHTRGQWLSVNAAEAEGYAQ